MEELELAQIFGSLAAGLGAFYSSHNKKLPYFKSILSMFIAIVFFYIGAEVAIYILTDLK